MIKNQLDRLEWIGVGWITVVGSLFHFCYDWSNGWVGAGIFCAVNESVWEHMKIGFWPALFYGIFLYFYLEDVPRNFLFAETIGLYMLTITIPVLYYSYTALLGQHFLIIDIMIFIISVILGRFTSYWLIKKEIEIISHNQAVLLLIILLFVFSTFTYYPPKLPIFKDPTGYYGPQF